MPNGGSDSSRLLVSALDAGPLLAINSGRQSPTRPVPTGRLSVRTVLTRPRLRVIWRQGPHRSSRRPHRSGAWSSTLPWCEEITPMDAERFANLSRRLATAVSRRHSLRLLAGGALGALVGVRSIEESAAATCQARDARCGVGFGHCCGNTWSAAPGQMAPGTADGSPRTPRTAVSAAYSASPVRAFTAHAAATRSPTPARRVSTGNVAAAAMWRLRFRPPATVATPAAT
jgi:hypothetical protein